MSHKVLHWDSGVTGRCSEPQGASLGLWGDGEMLCGSEACVGEADAQQSEKLGLQELSDLTGSYKVDSLQSTV